MAQEAVLARHGAVEKLFRRATPLARAAEGKGKSVNSMLRDR